MNITIIGLGNMGRAFAVPLAKTNQVTAYVREESDQHRNFAKKARISLTTDLSEAIRASDFIILAFKPKDLEKFSKEVEKFDFRSKYCISMLAKVSLSKLKQSLPQVSHVRVMTGLACEFGMGVVGFCYESRNSQDLQEALSASFAPLGSVYFLNEDEFNAFTIIAGSGPGFVAYLIESMLEAAADLGIDDKEKATDYVYGIFKTTVLLLQATGESPETLQKRVASKGGCTIQGLEKMDELSVGQSINQAVVHSYDFLNKD